MAGEQAVMATRIGGTKPAKAKPIGAGGPNVPGPNGKGPRGNGRQGGEDDDSGRRLSPAAYRIAMWIVLAAVVMMFAALSSVYIILSANQEWRPVSVPRMFYLSTGVILLSSGTLHTAQRSLKQGRWIKYTQWLGVTLILGALFLAFQLLAWRELIAQGIYLASNPHSSFFYLFTGVHGVHVLGGIFGLAYMFSRMRKPLELIEPERLEASAGAVSLYWHAMDGLWVWLFLLLLIWR